ncbi:MAG: hypothetical protein HDR99_05815 [Bacteroides sp.]|nr:hypothetical protein [Bacteroides sp.]
MIGFGIAAGLIVTFIVFTELHSIRQILNQHFKNVEYESAQTRALRHAEYGLKERKEAVEQLISLIEQKRINLTPSERGVVNHAKYIIHEDEIFQSLT